ncbi:MAG: IclR family transcriptional regulator [Bacillota bacterium]
MGRLIRSVRQAFAILEALSLTSEGMGVTAVARQLALGKSTIHAQLTTLCQLGYVEKDPTSGNYRLGIRLFQLANAVPLVADLRSAAGPYLQQLVEKYQETAHLVILDGGEVLYVDKRESPRSTHVVSQVGRKLPCHCTGVGKVLLAHLPKDQLGSIIEKGLPRFTARTITDPHRLYEELKLIQERGYAIDDEEIMDGLRCVAAPIRNYTGSVIAAISVSGPVSRMPLNQLPQIAKEVIDTANRISYRLGWNPDRHQAAFPQ